MCSLASMIGYGIGGVFFMDHNANTGIDEDTIDKAVARIDYARQKDGSELRIVLHVLLCHGGRGSRQTKIPMVPALQTPKGLLNLQ